MVLQESTSETPEQGDVVPSQLAPPIARLPPEILPIIFFEAVQTSPSKSVTILNISRVSQLWRHIALSTPELWTWIDTPDVGIIQTLMIRAKDRPLSVTLEQVSESNELVPLPISTVLKSLYNIRHLEFSVNYDDEWSRLGPFSEMSGPAPVLETLHLDGVRLPETLFSDSAPSLRTLHLSTVDVEWRTIPDCPQLRSLSINQPEIPISVPDFLQRLQTFPLLEKIETEWAFERNSLAVVLPGPVELTNLTYLLFDFEKVANVLFALKHLRFPSSCKIKLYVAEDEPDEHLSLFSALSTCRTGSPPNVRALKVIADSYLDIKLYEGDRKPRENINVNEDADDTRPNLVFKIRPPSEQHPLDTPRMATRICQDYLNLNHLEALDLFGKSPKVYPTKSFWEFINTLPNLRVLKVRHSYAKSFIEFLSRSLGFTRGELPPFSSVHKLVYEDPTNEGEEYSIRLVLLVQKLQIRAVMGVPLKTLTLVQVGTIWVPIPDGLFVTLGGAVGQVKRKIKRLPYDQAQLVKE
ncbi:hypothetical protein BDN72DRAFT_849771 [Pluteus cervinus]|uniref:Uncharacterized protein n=1 Tax=Pluteus cervinus TaxID=181527 RepID=A0ACD3A6R0_9AGAR|nr:hypothetical protein BDN72DRAFT_849771 [Pluteus cervinus]